MTAVVRLAEIEARAAAATDGPWEASDFGYGGTSEPESIVVHTGPFIWNDIRDGEFVVTTPSWDSQEGADAAFIAAARQDVPALVTALRAVLDGHEADDEGFCEACFTRKWPCDLVHLITAALDPS